MALFSRTKKTVEASDSVVVEKTANPANVAHVTDRNQAAVLLRPVITEKAVMHQDKRVYTFLVAKSATKFSVRDAITTLYKVTPVKVNIVNKMPSSSMSRSRGRAVAQSGYKKAYVYLKSGDTINLV